MKRIHLYITKKNLFLAAALLVVLALLFIRPSLFTVQRSALDQAAARYKVRLEDRGRSFDILPDHQNRGIGIIFYPGALVDAKAYTPELAAIAKGTGARVFIVKPSLRLAVLEPDAAKDIMEDNPAIKNWYVGGHSMGGGVACNFSARNPSLVRGLFLLAAYCSPGARQFSGRTLAVVGTHDRLEPPAKVKTRLPDGATVVQIEGANHAGFGNYGSQPFDGHQTISEAAMTKALRHALEGFIE